MVELSPRIHYFPVRRYPKQLFETGWNELQSSFERKYNSRSCEEAALVISVLYKPCVMRMCGRKAWRNVQDQYLGTAGVWTGVALHRKLDL
jgi:hypothetical protein